MKTIPDGIYDSKSSTKNEDEILLFILTHCGIAARAANLRKMKKKYFLRKNEILSMFQSCFREWILRTYLKKYLVAP